MPQIEDFKCPNCGGAVSFQPDVQKLKCPYCNAEFDVGAAQAAAQSIGDDNIQWQSIPNNTFSEEDSDVVTYVCNSCGGSILCEKNTVATSCPYCDSPVVMSENVAGILKPDYVIPFKLTKEQAKEALKNHLSKKFFMPKIFKQENHLDEIKALYVPFWLFDTDADGKIRYRATRTRVWSDKDYTYTETSFFLCYREGSIAFERVPVDASEKVANDLTESLEPFDMNEAVPFETAYLAGFLADKYDVSDTQSTERANERVKRSVEDAFMDTVNGYTSVTVQDSSVTTINANARYALLPVYILNTTWKGKKYVFGMNGQTGKFVGNLPLDKGKFARWLIGLGLGISIVIYLIRFLFMYFGGLS